MQNFKVGDRVVILKGQHVGEAGAISFLNDQKQLYLHGDWQQQPFPTFYGPFHPEDLKHEE